MENRQQLNEKTHTALILILLIIIPVSGFSLWMESPEDVLIKALNTFCSNNPNKTYNYVSTVVVEERGSFTLVKEEDRWKVLLDPENSTQ